MARGIGLSRPIKLEWLDKTVELLNENKTESQITSELGEYLSFEIKDKTNLNKTRSSLLKSWVKVPEENLELRDLAIQCHKNNHNNRVAVHWCMLMAAYPVFYDVCTYVGKIFNIQDTFTTAWLKQKLAESWGERTTLLYSVDKILKTLKNLGVIENVSVGVYKCNEMSINDPEVIKLFIMTILRSKEKSYYEISEISQTSSMFPFKFDVSHELLHNTDQFSLNNFGGKVVLTDD